MRNSLHNFGSVSAKDCIILTSDFLNFICVFQLRYYNLTNLTILLISYKLTYILDSMFLLVEIRKQNEKGMGRRRGVGRGIAGGIENTQAGSTPYFAL